MTVVNVALVRQWHLLSTICWIFQKDLGKLHIHLVSQTQNGLGMRHDPRERREADMAEAG